MIYLFIYEYPVIGRRFVIMGIIPPCAPHSPSHLPPLRNAPLRPPRRSESSYVLFSSTRRFVRECGRPFGIWAVTIPTCFCYS